jgi:antitoxin component YwqK of YwqJK toxin-antitoxin module
MAEKFDIERFNKHQVNGDYNRVLEDGTQINQYGDPSGYFENIIPPAGWFYTYKEFYSNGNLKEGGQLFKKGDFRAGIWNEYDSSGNKTKETNYDHPFKLTVNGVLNIISKTGVAFSLNEKYDMLDRDVTDSGAVWIVDWKSRSKQNWVDRAIVDDATGKIVEKTGYMIKKN